jgi:glycosyltransferase involved in cell wall biosynthesis
VTRPRLMTVASTLSWPIREGYTLRVAGLLPELARDWDLTLVALTGEPDAADPPDGVRFVPVRKTGAAFLPSPADWQSLIDTATSIREAEEPDAVLSWARLGASELAPGRAANFVLDLVDCHTLENWRAMKHSRHPVAALRLARELASSAREERRLGRNAFAVATVGELDARVLRGVIGRDNVHVVPNGVHVGTRIESARDERPTICFTGVMGYPPNAEAVLFFVEEVWPSVLRAVPDAVFLVAGRDPTPEIMALERSAGVEVLGAVPDMGEILRRAWAAVAPMRTGTGIKNKVLEAWAVGTPVVMTPLAANGLGDAAAIREMTRAQAAELATLTISLLRDAGLRTRMGNAVYELARERSWAAVARPLSDLLLRAAGTSPGANLTSRLAS